MSLHLTERDRRVSEAGAAHQEAVRAFEQAEADGTLALAHFEARRAAKAALDREIASPTTYKCSDCGSEREIKGHFLLTVIAWSEHVVETDQWSYQEYDRSAVRHLVFCRRCKEKHGHREKMHERDLDKPIRPVAELHAENEILRRDNETLQNELRIATARLKEKE
jgi:DNA-directed RNA polymerase subunit M/transcription elongation factor TFIIS